MNEWLDDDGYPTEQTLDAIGLWGKSFHELMEFIKPLWKYSDSGYWHEYEVTEDPDNQLVYDTPRIRYELSTGGWSGNEDIIRALNDNHLFWVVCWVQSRRGGHYIFELREIE